LLLGLYDKILYDIYVCNFDHFCTILRTLCMYDCSVNDIFDILIWMCIFLCVFHGKQIEIAKVSVFIFSAILNTCKYVFCTYLYAFFFVTCFLYFWKNKFILNIVYMYTNKDVWLYDDIYVWKYNFAHFIRNIYMFEYIHISAYIYILYIWMNAIIVVNIDIFIFCIYMWIL